MAEEKWIGKERRVGALGGKVALVTGASRGIGRAIALELAHRSAVIAVNYRTHQDLAESLAEEIRAFGGCCEVFQGDVSLSGEARKVVQEVVERLSRIDILVNNAGITRDKSLSKMTDEDWAHVINVNLNGTFYCTSAVLPVMMAQKFGRIINISSLIGQIGGFGQANYAASKGGIAAFTKALALETAKHNITANCIAPGYTGTEMVAAMPEEVLDKIRMKIPLQRLGRPEEIAKAAAFLALDGDYITGQELAINGGIAM